MVRLKCSDNSSYLRNVSPAAEYKMEACLPATLANHQKGHLIYRGRWVQKHRGRCSHNRQHQHVRHHCVPAATKRTPALCPGAQIWTNKQSARTTASLRPYSCSTMLTIDTKYGGILRHNNMKCNAELQARGTWNCSTCMLNCQHLQHYFSDELAYSFLNNSWCQLWLKKLHHRKEGNSCNS